MGHLTLLGYSLDAGLLIIKNKFFLFKINIFYILIKVINNIISEPQIVDQRSVNAYTFLS